MSKVFVNIGLSLDGYMAPEGMTMENWDQPGVVLPQPEPVWVPGGKVADVQTGAAEPRDLSHLSLREEPIRDSALIEDLDGA